METFSYRVRPMHDSSKLVVEFHSRPEDGGFREALSSIFEPLGYVPRFDGHYFYISPGPTTPHEGKISISSDEFGMVWGDGDPWGDLQSNHKYVEIINSLLENSGLFSKVG